MSAANSFPKTLEADPPQTRAMVKQFCDDLGLKDPMTQRFMMVVVHCARVFDYKQGKYGPGNIAEFGEIGVMIRISDKLKRRINLWRTGQTPVDETIEDTWGDAANYSIIALMCRYGLWPGADAAKS